MINKILDFLGVPDLILNGEKLAGLASLMTRYFAPGRLALQVKTGDGAVYADDGFKQFFPGVVDKGGIENVWADLTEHPAHDYAESPDWIFVKFIDGEPNIDGEHVIPRDKMAVILNWPENKDNWPQGKLFYFDKFTLSRAEDYGALRGAEVLWLMDATEDLRMKREQRRSEVAARAILDALFNAGAYRPPNFAFRSLPKNGSRRLGGDFFYLRRFPEADNGALERICLFVGDCTGHGVGGALLAATAGSILQRLFRASRTWHLAPNPALRVIEYLDRELKTTLTDAAAPGADGSSSPRRAYAAPGAVDGCCIVFDYTRETGNTAVFAAGGNIPVWLTRQGAGPSREQAVVKILGYDPTGWVKNLGPKSLNNIDTEYQQFTSLESSALRICIVSDGYYLQRNAPRENEDSQPLGVDSIPVVFYQARDCAAEEAAQSLLDHWTDFKQGQEQDDDLLLTVLDVPQSQPSVSKPGARHVGDDEQ